MDTTITQYNWNINDDENDNEKNQQIIGYNVIYSNIIACLSIGNIMTTLLGPKSRDKLLVNQFGEIIITNDGVTVLKSINIENIASRMMVELSTSMDDQNGDGTTSVVVLATLLMKKALILLDGGKGSSMRIIKGFINASLIAQNTIRSMAKQFTLEDDIGKNILLKTSKTTLNSKLVSHLSPSTLSLISVEATMLAYRHHQQQKTTVNNIKIIPLEGLSINQSFVINSTVYDDLSFLNTFYQTNNNNIKLVLIGFSFTKRKSTIINDQYLNIINNSLESTLDQQESNIKSIVVSLKKLKVNMVAIEEDFNQSNSLSTIAISYFEKAKITLIKPLPFKKLIEMSKELNIPMITDIDQLKQKDIDTRILNIEKFEIKVINGKNLMFIQHPHSSPCIVLGGSTKMELEESERALHDSLCVLENLLKEPSVVPGGGACEISSSVDIIDHVKSINQPTIDSMSMVSYAQALEEIPAILCRNAGLFNNTNIIERLKYNHSTNNSNRMMGVDLMIDIDADDFNDNNVICDMMEHGVLETLSNKLAQITMATEIVVSILKIDQIIKRSNK